MLVTGRSKSTGLRLALIGLTSIGSSAAHAEESVINPPRIYLTSPTGVSLQDGKYTYSNTDLALGPFSLVRSYQGGKSVSGSPFGYGWTHNYVMYLIGNCPNPSPCTHVVIGRTSYKFIPAGAGTYQGVSDISTGTIDNGISLTQGSAGLQFTDRMGTVYEFNSSSQVWRITYPNGHVLDFTYDASHNLRSVTSNTGYMLGFEYNASGKTSAACAFNLARAYVSSLPSCASGDVSTSYQHGSIPTYGDLLTGFTDAMGNVSTISYVGEQVSCVTLPGSSTCPVTNTFYDGSHMNMRTWQVKQQTTADGKIWGFSYSGDYDCAMCEDSPADLNSTYMTDPNQAVTRLDLYGKVPDQLVDANGHITKIYTSMLAATDGPSSEGQLPEGNSLLYSRNSRGIISGATWSPKTGSAATPISTSSQFPTCTSANYRICSFPTSTNDERGNQTNFTYDATSGGVLSQMKPAAVAGAARPLKLTSWVQKYAYVRNSSGTLVAAASPIWVKATETECQTAAGSSSPVCDTTKPQLVTTYEYGANGTANNLNVRGVVVSDGTTSRRSCYGYDDYGNRVWQTLPRAGLAVCP